MSHQTAATARISSRYVVIQIHHFFPPCLKHFGVEERKLLEMNYHYSAFFIFLVSLRAFLGFLRFYIPSILCGESLRIKKKVGQLPP